MKRWKLTAVIVSSILTAVISFGLLFFFDNKYQWPGPAGKAGVTDLTGWDEESLVFLVHGWEVYEDRLLEPGEIRAQALSPDRYVYIGQYGGFEFGDSEGEPTGSATYRMRLILNPEERQYCLELPEIYSAYSLWIDGTLVKSVGEPKPEDYRARTQITSQEFRASGETEILLWVSNFTSFYSGMVYPPAFGTPDMVGGMQHIYLITHTILVFCSLFLGIICLIVSLQGKEERKRSRLFFLFCLFYAAYVGYPLIHTLGFQGMGWYLLEKVGLYAMLLILAMLTGELGGIPAGVRAAVFAVGNMACMLVILFPFLPMRWQADVMRLYSGLLGFWQWTAAVYLFAVSAFFMRRKDREAAILAWGMVYFGIALLVNRLLAPYEPVYSGWPPEIGGGLIVALIGGFLVHRSRESYRQRLRTEKLRELAYQELDAQRKYSEMLTEYLERTGKRNHEFKKNLELMMYYLEQEDYRKLREFLAGLHKREEGIGMPLYTVNPLINSIMATRHGATARAGIDMQYNLLNLPRELPMEDGELCSLLTNLLDNAIEGAGRLGEDREKWTKVGMEFKGNCFSVLVENSAVEPDGRGAAVGPDGRGASVGPDRQGASMGPDGRGASVGPGRRGASMGSDRRGAAVEPDRQGALMEPARRRMSLGRTQKEDSMSHGYGMGIISEIVKSHNGIEEIRWEKGTYLHHVVLFLRPKGD